METGVRARVGGAFLMATLCTLWGLSAAARAVTVYVDAATGNDAWDGLCEIWDGGTCGPKATIQAGINIAIDGDTVLVADGVYTGTGNRDLDPLGRLITIRSTGGDPAACVIDCQDAGRGFYFNNWETPDTVVNGFTITNGNGLTGGVAGDFVGGGVYCGGDTSATITNCRITNCHAADAGGGVDCEPYSAPVITGCSITSDQTSDDPYIPGEGAGVYCNQASPVFTNCVISDNTCHEGDGGGVFGMMGGSPRFIACIFVGNTGDRGGAAFCNGTSARFTNCTITRNTVTGSKGAGVYCAYAGATTRFLNCTFAGNTCDSPGSGAALYCDGTSPIVTNCIFWGDQPGEVGGSAATVTYSDVQGGYTGTGNINADPLFLDPNGDYHLSVGSPCIDAGNNVSGLPATDLDGRPRKVDGNGDGSVVVDMGAYEFDPNTPSIGVSPLALELFLAEGTSQTGSVLTIYNSGGGVLNWQIQADCPWLHPVPASGSSAGEADPVAFLLDPPPVHGHYECTLTISDPAALNNPRTVPFTLTVNVHLQVPSQYGTIQAALDAAIEGDEVVVANGTYTGPGNKDLNFHGKAVRLRSASRSPALCVIDCEGVGRGFGFNSGETSSTVVEGLTVRNGLAPGGAIYCNHAGPLFTDCVLSGNTSNSEGGAVCTLADPYDRWTLYMTRCTLVGNSAASHGGAVYATFGGDLKITECLIAGNTAAYGGGVCATNQTANPYEPSAQLINCLIVGNSASVTGGGVLALGGPMGGLTGLANCTLAGNTAPHGRALWADGDMGGLAAQVFNCIFWNGGNEIDGCTYSPYQVQVVSSDVCGGWVGTEVMDADPLFVDPNGPDGDPNTWADNDYHLGPGSPCIDAGSNGAMPPGDVADIDGQLRRWDGDGDTVAIVDMGSDEFGSTVRGDLNCDAAVDFGDINPFVLALIDPTAYDQMYPDCDLQVADINADGTVDFGDINPFVALLTGGG